MSSQEKLVKVSMVFHICKTQQYFHQLLISSVQSLSHVRLFATPRFAACQASLSIPTPGGHSDSHPLNQ